MKWFLVTTELYTIWGYNDKKYDEKEMNELAAIYDSFFFFFCNDWQFLIIKNLLNSNDGSFFFFFFKSLFHSLTYKLMLLYFQF